MQTGAKLVRVHVMALDGQRRPKRKKKWLIAWRGFVCQHTKF